MNSFTPLIIEIKNSNWFKTALFTSSIAIPVVAVLLGTVWYTFRDIASDTAQIATTTPIVRTGFVDPLKTEIAALNASLTTQQAQLPEELQALLKTSRIYLMLGKKELTPTLPEPYVLENMTLTHSTLTDFVDLYHTVSSNGSLMTYFAGQRKTIDRSWETWEQDAALYSYETRRVGRPPFPLTETLTTIIDTPSIRYAQLPAIANSGKVVFAGWLPVNYEPTGPLEVERWTLFHAAHNDIETQSIAYGYNPLWLNDQYILYLGEQGLYIVDANTFAKQRIYETPDPVFSNEHLDLSSDGTLLIWSRPNSDQIHVFDVDKEARTVSLRTTIPGIRAFWTQLSPDNSHLVYITSVQDPQFFEEKDAHIEFLDLTTGQIESNARIPLTTFDPKNSRITDWVQSNI